MNARELMDELFLMDTTADYTNTRDTFKAGDPEMEIKKVGVCMFSPANLLKEAASWGADLLIVHESTYINMGENTQSDPVYLGKKEIVEGSGMAICRLHDHMHHAKPDGIGVGEMELLGLGYTHVANPYYAVNRFELDEPIKASELLDRIKTVLGVRHARLCGDPDMTLTHISGCFGTPGHILDEINDDWGEMVLAGEAAEWCTCEYIRDAAALGMKKSMIVMGHCGSERDGMIYLAEQLGKAHPELEVRYFECDEPFM